MRNVFGLGRRGIRTPARGPRLGQGGSVPGVGPAGAIACPSGGGFDLVGLDTGRFISNVPLATAQSGQGVHIVNASDPRCAAAASGGAPGGAPSPAGVPAGVPAAGPAGAGIPLRPGGGGLRSLQTGILQRFRGAGGSFGFGDEAGVSYRAVPAAAPPPAALMPPCPPCPPCPTPEELEAEAAGVFAVTEAEGAGPGLATILGGGLAAAGLLYLLL